MLTDTGRLSTTRWGQTHVEGEWNGQRLTVTSQRRPVPSDYVTTTPPGPAPCPAPHGGWKVGATQSDSAIDRIAAAVGPDFGTLGFAYPSAAPRGVNGLANTKQILVVAVTGDRARATAAIRSIFTGNLCVVPTTVTAAQAQQQAHRLQRAIAPQWQRLGIISVGGGANYRPVTAGNSPPSVCTVQVVVDTPELERLIAAIPGPPILVDAWIKPL